jgi:hypothetical protein
MSNSNALLCARRFALGLLVILSACSTFPRRAARDAAPPAVLSYEYVLGPVLEDSELDIEATPTSKNPAVHLRRAWLMLQRKRPAESVEACALVLYGTETPSLQAEAFGRYIRAEALAAMGKAKSGDYDLKRALEIAMDQRLRDRIEDAMPAAAPAEASPRVNPVASAPQIDMHTRSEWQPAALIRSRLDPMGKIYRITVHHSAILLRSQSESAAADQIRSIQNTHMKKEGCGDIGYHFLIDPSGRIWQGRELRYQGAHARGDNNRGNIGICVLGNFMRGRDGQRPTAAELEALENLIASLAQRHGVAQDQIFCHSDLVNTQCPGPYLRSEVDRIARAAAAPARGRGAVAE